MLNVQIKAGAQVGELAWTETAVRWVTLVAATKLHASGPQENRTTLQHEQRSPGE
jgi:hypothetical protein